MSQLFLQEGWQVYGTSRQSSAPHTKLLNLQKIKWICAVDYLTLSDVVALCDRVSPDIVVHLSGFSSVSQSFHNYKSCFEGNLISTLNLLEATRRLHDKKPVRFFHACSSEVFGNIPHPFKATVDWKKNPVSPYGISKAQAAEWVSYFRTNYNLWAINGYLFNHESEIRPPHFFLKSIIRQAIAVKSGEADVIEVGDLSVIRDFGSAHEYMRVIKQILIDDAQSPDDFILCSGVERRLLDIVRLVVELVGCPDAQISKRIKLCRKSEIPRSVGDSQQVPGVNTEESESFQSLISRMIEFEMKNVD